jgi:hypothetical protein
MTNFGPERRRKVLLFSVKRLLLIYWRTLTSKAATFCSFPNPFILKDLFKKVAEIFNSSELHEVTQRSVTRREVMGPFPNP